MSIEDIKGIMDAFDPAQLLPPLDSLPAQAALVCRVCVIAGPIVLLALGLAYLLLAPKEANYTFGYRTFFGMGSIEAWRFTQRLAGLVFAVLGLILTLVMTGKANGFQELAVTELIDTAVNCLLWEAGCALAAIVAVNITVAVLFDFKGMPRFRFMKK